MVRYLAIRLLLAICLSFSAFAGSAGASDISPEEKQLFTVSGIDVDAKGKDASEARMIAIQDAQVKAFAILIERLAGKQVVPQLADLEPQAIGRLMASLSVSSEQTAPGRYIAKLNISFLPDRVRDLLQQRSIGLSPVKQEPVLILPIWQGAGELPVTWDDNPWRRAILRMDLNTTRVALRLPLGDLEDSTTLPDPERADPASFAPLLNRYGATAAVVVIATQDPDGIRLKAIAPQQLPGLVFPKAYPATEQGLSSAAVDVVAAIAQNWRDGATAENQIALPPDITDANGLPLSPQQPTPPNPPVNPVIANAGVLDAAMLFQPVEWGSLRQLISSTEGVKSVDLLRITPDGGLIRITYSGAVPQVQQALFQRGFRLVDLGSGWILQRQ